ncbi:hypothetical protein [Paenibacillus sp. FSL H8-0283]|uniref:hypothetical protein n=1 Tax=Paenibacillus sp. FSL H8-0283 TaxID=2921383 RepID=UPI0032506D8B
MAQNSFLIKGWYFSVIIVVSAFKISDPWYYTLLISLTSFVFYSINLQFYIYERKFRNLYYERIEMRSNGDFENELYSLKFPQVGGQIGLINKILSVWEYAQKNKMLMFMYFGICSILIGFKWLGDGGSEIQKIFLEISGMVKLGD